MWQRLCVCLVKQIKPIVRIGKKCDLTITQVICDFQHDVSWTDIGLPECFQRCCLCVLISYPTHVSLSKFMEEETVYLIFGVIKKVQCDLMTYLFIKINKEPKFDHSITSYCETICETEIREASTGSGCVIAAPPL